MTVCDGGADWWWWWLMMATELWLNVIWHVEMTWHNFSLLKEDMQVMENEILQDRRTQNLQKHCEKQAPTYLESKIILYCCVQAHFDQRKTFSPFCNRAIKPKDQDENLSLLIGFSPWKSHPTPKGRTVSWQKYAKHTSAVQKNIFSIGGGWFQPTQLKNMILVTIGEKSPQGSVF